MNSWIAIGVGLSLLVLGAEFLVRGASTAALRLGVSPLVIGLTLVGFGTSSPELVTSLHAVLTGAPAISVGNVVGANISNALLVLGVTALAAPVVIHRRAFRRDGPVLATVTAASIWAMIQGLISRPMGLIAVAALAAYLVAVWLLERKRDEPAGERLEDEAEMKASWRTRLWPSLLLAGFGIGMTVFGARFLVEGSVEVAQSLGVSESIIALTIVSLGTTSPELVTSVVAALRRQGDVALGNIIGSNLYNLLGVLGLTAIIKPIAVPAEIAAVDVWVLAASTAAMILFALNGAKIGRLAGLSLLSGYAGYLAWLAYAAGLL